MTILLRTEMILLSLFLLFVVLHAIQRKRLCIQYSLIWILIAVSLLVIAIFPDIVFWLCGILDIEKPSNLIYLLGIVALLLIMFSQAIVISEQAESIKTLTQIVSMEKFFSEEQIYESKISKRE